MPHDNSRRSDADIAAVELELGRRLPDDFRWFCLEHGAGDLRRRLSIKVRAEESDPEELGRDTIGFARLGYFRSLQDSRRDFAPPYAAEAVLPCATTIWGDVFFLRLDELHNGSIWFWDDFYERDPQHGLLRAAHSFTDLLSSSVEAPDGLD